MAVRSFRYTQLSFFYPCSQMRRTEPNFLLFNFSPIAEKSHSLYKSYNPLSKDPNIISRS